MEWAITYLDVNFDCRISQPSLRLCLSSGWTTPDLVLVAQIVDGQRIDLSILEWKIRSIMEWTCYSPIMGSLTSEAPIEIASCSGHWSSLTWFALQPQGGFQCLMVSWLSAHSFQCLQIIFDRSKQCDQPKDLIGILYSEKGLIA